MSEAPRAESYLPAGLDELLEVLQAGDLEMLGYLPYASNATLLATVRHQEFEGFAVYKPRRGESPLWDFPSGTLCLRECAAWIVDQRLGWELVPPTVLRDGPAGFGAVQLFVDEDEDADLEEMLRSRPDELMRMAAFDLLVNNADRKRGHCIVDRAGKLWGIDHGICFHSDYKLRTVLWAFEHDPLPKRLVSDLRGLAASLDRKDDPLVVALSELLSGDEIVALGDRACALADVARFPERGRGRHVPWPPW